MPGWLVDVWLSESGRAWAMQSPGILHTRQESEPARLVDPRARLLRGGRLGPGLRLRVRVERPEPGSLGWQEVASRAGAGSDGPSLRHVHDEPRGCRRAWSDQPVGRVGMVQRSVPRPSRLRVGPRRGRAGDLDRRAGRLARRYSAASEPQDALTVTTTPSSAPGCVRASIASNEPKACAS